MTIKKEVLRQKPGETKLGFSLQSLKNKINELVDKVNNVDILNILNVGWYDARKYATDSLKRKNGLAGAINNIGSANKTILITNQQDMPASITVPVNITLKFMQGGFLNIDSGKVVTINGHVEAGLYQIFKGSGTVVFGVGSAKEVYPEWWGDNTTPGTTNMGTIALKAVTSILTGGTVKFSDNTYYFGTQVLVTGGANINVIGCGDCSQITLAAPTTTTGNPALPLNNGFVFTNSSGIKVKDLYFIGQWVKTPWSGTSRTDSNGIVFTSRDGNVTNIEVSNCRFYNVSTGILVDGNETFTTTYIKGFEIHNNKIEKAVYGIFPRTNVYHGTVSNNVVYNTSGMGICLDNPAQHATEGVDSFVTVTGNVIDTSYAETIIANMNQVTVSGNTCKNANVGIRVGVTASSVHGVSVSGNTIIGMGTAQQTTELSDTYYTDYGIVVNASSTKISIVGNSIDNYRYDGILSSGRHVTISGNQISMATSASNRGINISPLSAAAIYGINVTGNEISGSDYGIQIGCLEATAQTTSYCKISSNLVYGATYGIVILSYTQYNTISDNQFYNATNGVSFNLEAGAYTSVVGNLLENNRFYTGTNGIVGAAGLTAAKWAEMNNNVFIGYTKEAVAIATAGLFLDRKWFYARADEAIPTGSVVIHQRNGNYLNNVYTNAGASDGNVAGVVIGSGAAGANEALRVVTEGYVETVNVQGNVTANNYLRTSATKSRAEDAGAAIIIGVFGYAITAYAGGAAGTVSAYVFPPIRN